MKIEYTLLLSIAILFFTPKWATGQALSQNNHYIQNPVIYNPAAAGITGNITLFADYRDQWYGFAGAPQTLSFGAHGLITHSMGIGIITRQETVGVFNKSDFDFLYSYRIKIDNNQTLAGGLLLGYQFNKLDLGGLSAEEVTDIISYYDNLKDARFNVGLGFHYTNNDFSFQLSSPSLFRTKNNQLLNNAYAIADYSFYLNANEWEVKPFGMYQYNSGKLHQFELGVMGKYKQRVWSQLKYRFDKYAVASIGVQFNGLSLAYSYEVNFSKIRLASPGTHQVFISYEIPIKKIRRKIIYQSSARNK